MSFARRFYLVGVKPSDNGTFAFIIYLPIFDLFAIRIASGNGYTCEREAELAAWRLIGRTVPNR